jgi:hypothetical protein
MASAANAQGQAQGQSQGQVQGQGQNGPNERFMFVSYSGPPPNEPPAAGQKKRRGGPSEVRAHITKEFHRKLRVQRLTSLHAEPSEAMVSLPVRRKSTPLTNDQSWGKKGGRVVDIEEIESVPTDGPPRRTSSSSSTSQQSPTTISPSSFSDDLALQMTPPLQPRTFLGAGRMDPFNMLPSGGNNTFINQVLDHGRSLVALLPSPKISRRNKGRSGIAQHMSNVAY